MNKIIPAISLLYSIQIEGIVSLKEEKVWQILSDQGVFILKLLPFPPGETGFITDAMSYLSNHGFHRFNEIIPTVHGTPSAPYGDSFTLLTKELTGRTPSFTEKSDVAAAAACLADLHQAAVGFFPAHRFAGRLKFGEMIRTVEAGRTDLLSFQRCLDAKAEKDSFDTVFLEHCPIYLKEMEEVASALATFYPAFSASRAKQGGFCHHDPAYHNFFIGTDQTASVCDFDYAIADLGAHDVADLLLKILKTNNWEVPLALDALNAYRERLALSREELHFIYLLLQYPYDFRHAAFARYAENDGSSRIAKKLPRFIREAPKRQRALALLNQCFAEES